MGLFDLVKGLSFFQGRHPDGLTQDDVDFEKWIGAHRAWRHRLSDYIHGAGKEEFDESQISRDDRCELGAWINGSGNRFYGKLPVFAKLRDQHARFHRSAGNVVHIYKREGQHAATKALHIEFDLVSLKVIEHLESLEHEVKGAKQR